MTQRHEEIPTEDSWLPVELRRRGRWNSNTIPFPAPEDVSDSCPDLGAECGARPPVSSMESLSMLRIVVARQLAKLEGQAGSLAAAVPATEASLPERQAEQAALGDPCEWPG